mmetsp:Transcript_156838/g.300817  ORF Transcript_156838/g.300817 Transcript_156838/m.300817 type:complete len:214 (+) Transcript_156838:138-779(+)
MVRSLHVLRDRCLASLAWLDDCPAWASLSGAAPSMFSILRPKLGALVRLTLCSSLPVFKGPASIEPCCRFTFSAEVPVSRTANLNSSFASSEGFFPGSSARRRVESLFNVSVAFRMHCTSSSRLPNLPCSAVSACWKLVITLRSSTTCASTSRSEHQRASQRDSRRFSTFWIRCSNLENREWSNLASIQPAGGPAAGCGRSETPSRTRTRTRK